MSAPRAASAQRARHQRRRALQARTTKGGGRRNAKCAQLASIRKGPARRHARSARRATSVARARQPRCRASRERTRARPVWLTRANATPAQRARRARPDRGTTRSALRARSHPFRRAQAAPNVIQARIRNRKAGRSVTPAPPAPPVNTWQHHAVQ